MAEPWGGPDRRELLGELVRCSEVDFCPNIFPLHKVLREKNTHGFNGSFSPLWYIFLVVVDGDRQSHIDP